MGKKRVAVLGDILEEETTRTKRAVQREQKAIRQGKKVSTDEQVKIETIKITKEDKAKSAKVSGMKGGERVVDTATESLEELERLQAKQQQIEQLAPDASAPSATPAIKKQKRVRSNRYKQARMQVSDGKNYSLNEALDLLRKLNLTKFPATVEIHLNLIKQEAFTGQPVELPYGVGKSKKVAIFNDQLVSQLDQGTIDFDVLLASPQDMPKLVKYAKLLGPRGLMPNPKSGTIVSNPQAAASKFSADSRIHLKVEKKSPLIHTIAGKLSMKDDQLTANITTILNTVGKKNIQRAFLTTTMSPSVRLDLS